MTIVIPGHPESVRPECDAVAHIRYFPAGVLFKGELAYGETPVHTQLRRLERDFATAAQDFNQALRSAGLAGLDTTGDADAAMQEVLRIERKLDDLMRRLVTDDERRKAEQLKQRLLEFKRKVGA